ncbi:hypothetical protein BJ322DRAFT_1017019 [Thelephora terrestris]|uniref:Uncharacterized protein n=1 Tax=Thelephora terrestris TaxID=56493 RepID=A0A9P6HT66_9AGAM|nr:hypothetical protein BJ322DRAFT_1017019 [Thelephora terrestris]
MPTPLSEQHYNDDSSSEEPDAPRSLEDHLRDLQREASKLRAENRALKSTRPAKDSRPCSTASSVSLATHQEDDATVRGYRSAGKRFVLLSDLWPKESVLRLPYPPHLKSLGPWHSGRCASDAAWNEGSVAELYELLPERYHELIEHSALFADEFMMGAKSARTALIDTVRKNASRIFAIRLVTDVEMYAKCYNRSTVPVFANLLKSPKNPDETYATYPCILFKNYEVDNRGLFGSVAILNILKAVLYGPTAIGSTTESQRSGPKGSARTWELKTVTPGCIAMAAVVAQFIISPDQLFSEKGAISKINYRDRFKQYKRLIIKNIDTPRMVQLITRLNTELFHIHSPNEPSSAGARVVIDEEDEFCLAFQNEVTIDDSTESAQTEPTTDPILPPSLSVPTAVGPSTLPPNPNTPSTPPFTNMAEPFAASDSEGEPAGRPTAAKKKSKKGNDGAVVQANMRRTTRNAGGGTKKAGGAKTNKA